MIANATSLISSICLSIEHISNIFDFKYGILCRRYELPYMYIPLGMRICLYSHLTMVINGFTKTPAVPSHEHKQSNHVNIKMKLHD